MAKIIHRGNTVNLSFQFFDENGDLASPTSAICQLAWDGRDGRDTATLTLTQDGDDWKATWDSKVSRSCWVDYHAQADVLGASTYAEDGRFELRGNDANFQHDELPSNTGNYKDYAA